jgi:predicted PurR-regulated permease PerM
MAVPHSSSRHSIWDRLERPVTALIWLGIALVIIEIYQRAEFLVSHIFGVILLFIFAAIVAMLLNPVVDAMVRVPPFKGRRWAAVVTLLAVTIGVIAAAITLASPAVSAERMQSLQGQATAFLNQVQSFLARFGIQLKLSTVLSGINLGTVSSALSVLTGTVGILIDILLVVVISVYLLIQGRELVAVLRRLFPGREQQVDFILLATGSTVAAYFRGQLIMSTFMALYTGIALTIIGVHFAPVIAVLTFFLEFLPLVGAPIAMGLAVVIALFQSPLIAILAAAVAVGGHVLEAYVIGPRVTGHATRIHPLVAMAALLVGAELGGFLGALFAIPLAAVANVFLGALYRARRGQEALTTDQRGEVTPVSLPRLGDEIGDVKEESVGERPTPRAAGDV